MGQRGPTGAPAEVHQLFNDPSKLGASKLQPLLKPQVKIPAVPAYLGVRARAEWKRIGPELKRLGLVTDLDRATLAVYCQAVGEFEALEERIQLLTACVNPETLEAAGVEALLDVAPSGYRQIGALLQARDRAAERLQKVAREFGLTPAARLRVLSLPQLALFEDDDDPMTAFLRAGQKVG